MNVDNGGIIWNAGEATEPIPQKAYPPTPATAAGLF